MTAVRSPFEIAKQVLSLIKAQVVSQTDIISRMQFPYFFEEKAEEYKKQYGLEKIARFEEYLVKLEKIRDKATELLPLLQKRGAPSLTTTKHVAVTLCGVGECGETCNRALLEMIRAGCTEPLRIILVLGKARTLFPKTISDYYEHGFLIVGDVPPGWDKQTSLAAFGLLNEHCMLFDPSLGIIGKAKDTEKLLKKMFEAYKINRIAADLTYAIVPGPDVGRDLCETILRNAAELRNMIMDDLGFALSEKIILEEKSYSEASGAGKGLQLALMYLFNLGGRRLSKEERAQAQELGRVFHLK